VRRAPQQQQQQQQQQQRKGQQQVDEDSRPRHETQQQQQQQQQQHAPVYLELAAAAGAAVLREPQLLLVYGPALTLAGYPPFHARACQIYHMGPTRAAAAEGLAGALARYARALQRHGA
jgi:hypothetical protein